MSYTHHSPLPNGEAPLHQIGVETPGLWRRLSTTQTMHDGTVLLTWGVQVSGTQQWVGKAHAVGPSLDEKAEAFANAGLFAASKEMAILLMEATQAWAAQFDETDHIASRSPAPIWLLGSLNGACGFARPST